MRHFVYLFFWIFLTLTCATEPLEEDVETGEDLEDEDDFVQQISDKDLARMFHSIDANGDAKITIDEILAYARKMQLKIAESDVASLLEEMDKNEDGKLDKDEVQKDTERWSAEEDEDEETIKKRVALEMRKFDAADVNKDGFLSKDELPAYLHPSGEVLDIVTKEALKEKDANGDGMLSITEFYGVEAESDLTPEDVAEFERLTNGTKSLNQEGLALFESGVFAILEAMRKLFDIADGDRDGMINLDELLKAKGEFAGTDAHYHFAEWADHQEL